MADRAQIGSTVECDVRHPYPQTIRLTLDTPAAVDYANGLLADQRSGWRLADRCACFPGSCRGGEVIAGRLANGQRCQQHGKPEAS